MGPTGCNTLLRLFVACVIAGSAAGCATRFDESGRTIYVWQAGQDTSTAVDYSNPRLPVLPRGKTIDPLWPLPPIGEPRDMSEWARLEPVPEAAVMAAGRLGDNVSCAFACESPESGAIVVASAEPRRANLDSVTRQRPAR